MASRRQTRREDTLASRQRVRLFSWNIGTIIFGAIFVYMIVSLLLFLFSDHVEYYQVNTGPLARNQTYTGIAFRSEEIVRTDTSGYPSYYVQDGEKIRRSGMLFGIGSGQTERRAQIMTENTRKAVHETIRSFALGYDGVNFHDVYSLKYNITSKIVSDTPLLTEAMQAASFASNGTYTVGSETITASPKDAVVVYATDGYEERTPDTLTREDFDEKGYTLTDLRTNDRLVAGDAVCKLITSEAWSVVIPLTGIQVVRLDGISTIRVKFLKDGVTQNADITVFSGSKGESYARLDFQDGMIRYLTDRFIDLELVTNTKTGLKVPISSIVSKEFFTIPEQYATEGGDDGTDIGFMREVRKSDGTTDAEFVLTTLYEHKDGKYYIDSTDFKAGDAIVMKYSDGERYILRNTDTLEGVYCTNKGFALFRKIIILDKNEEYCIVESGTRYGISAFDYIVLNSDEVKEEQVIAKK